VKDTKNFAAGLLHKAVEDGRHRNYAAAVKKLKKVLELSDDFNEAHLYMGRAYHELGSYKDAIVSFRFFISKEPKSSAGYFYLGRTYIAAAYFQRAVSCFSESLRIKSDFAPALAYIGYALMRTGALSHSVNYLQKAVEFAPEDSKIYSMYINSVFMFSLKEFRKEHYEEALDGLIFLEKAGYTSITTTLYIGIILKELKRYSEAADYMSAAAAMSPDDNLIKNILAELYVRISKLDEAFNLLVTYMEQDQIKDFIEGIDNSEMNLAIAFWEKDEFRAALHFAIASLKKSRTPEMHLLAGECLKASGRLDDAYNHFCRAWDFDRRTIEPLYGQAVVMWLKEDYKTMLDIIGKVEAMSPADEFAAYYRILCSSELKIPFEQWKSHISGIADAENDPWILSASGFGEASVENYEKAVKLFQKALKLNNKQKKTWTGLLSALQHIGVQKQLMGSLKKYLRIFSDDTERREQYCELLMGTENFAAAANQYRLLMSAEKTAAGLLNKYAYCCRKAARFGDAAVVYRQILSQDPYNENYLKMLLFCMRKDGRDKETIPLLRQAVLEFKNPSIDLLLVYGVSLYRNDMDEEALNVFQKCVYNGSKDWRVFRNMGIIYRNKGLTEWSEMYLKKAEKLKKN